jgi:hypothetical protein
MLRSTDGLERGLQRLAAALIVPWVIGWISVYLVQTHKVRTLASEMSECSPSDTLCEEIDGIVSDKALSEGISLAQQRQNKRDSMAKDVMLEATAEQWVTVSEWFGLGGLVLIPLTLATFLWVWRGFPRQGPN